MKGFETGPRLLLVLPDLEPGGMPTRFLTCARAAVARGTGVTLVSGDGPLRDVAAAVCDLELVDWSGPRAETLAAVCEAADGHRAAVVALAPETVHVLGGLAARTALHICAHNPPGTFPGAWPAAALERLPGLLRALHGGAPASLSAPSARVARAHEHALGLPAGSIDPWPGGIDVGEVPPSPEGTIESVTVLCRLRADKAPVLAAAAELVAAGRALGSEAVLHVHGDGPDAAALEAVLAARLPAGAWQHHGPALDPLLVLRDADVVVAAGRPALEAVACGRRVAVARWRPHADGHLGPAVTAPALDDLLPLTMTWGDRQPLHPAAVWNDLEAMPAAAAAAAGEAIRARYSARASLDRLLTIVARTQSRPPVPRLLLGGLSDYAAAVLDELGTERRARSTAPTVTPNAA